MHPTNQESMLLTVQQEDPDSSKNDSENPGNVSEDELDMILATMGTTSLKDSELELLQNDVSSEEGSDGTSTPVNKSAPAEKVAPAPETIPEETPPSDTPPEEAVPVESVPKALSPEPPPAESQPAPRSTARRVVRRFFNKLRKVK